MSAAKTRAEPVERVRPGSALLGTVYLFTERVVSNEIDNGIQIELDALADEYDRDGRDGVVTELSRLNERWGRAGAIYLVVDRQFERLWLSHRLLARVRTVSVECERILGGDLTRRLPVTGESFRSSMHLAGAAILHERGSLRTVQLLLVGLLVAALHRGGLGVAVGGGGGSIRVGSRGHGRGHQRAAEHRGKSHRRG
jgi:hypothetical protein